MRTGKPFFYHVTGCMSDERIEPWWLTLNGMALTFGSIEPATLAACSRLDKPWWLRFNF